jgi:hypothetical protein
LYLRRKAVNNSPRPQDFGLDGELFGSAIGSRIGTNQSAPIISDAGVERTRPEFFATRALNLAN